MTGPLWIASYLVMASAVVFIGLALAGLYRISGSDGSPVTRRIAWPFTGLRPGDPAPTWMTSSVQPYISNPESVPTSPSTALVAVLDTDESGLATAASVALIGREMRTPWLLFFADKRVSGATLIEMASPELAAHTHFLDPEMSASIGVSLTPVVAVVKEGHIVDAVGGVLGPAQVRSLLQRFFVSHEHDVERSLRATLQSRR